MELGDTAIAALVTGKVPLTAKTVVHYSALPTREAVTFLANASADFDGICSSSPSDQGAIIGSR